MNADRWERLTDLYHAAVALPADERASLLTEECADDPSLRSEVERMIAAHDRASQGSEEGVRSNDLTPNSAPERIGPYRILKEIGRGRLGSLHLAERDDGRFDQRVVVTLLEPNDETERTLDRVRATHQTLSSRDHSNIARLIDCGTTEGGQVYVAMEYIEGEPIDAYADTQRLSVSERLHLFVQVCNAVAYAHRRRVIHGALGTSTILVTPTGVPKLLDFGLVERAASVADDIYSLGLVLDGLLGGRASANGGKERKVRGDLDTILLTALAQGKHRRYESVERLGDDIRRYLDRPPTRSRPEEGQAPSATSGRRRRRAALAWGIAAIAVVSLGRLIVSLVPRQADVAFAAPPPDNPTSRDRVLVADFTDRVGDPELTAMLSDAFRTGLGESQAVRVTTRHRGASTIVTGSIDSARGGYTITAQISHAKTGAEPTALRETAIDSGDVLRALGRLASRLREQLGETPSSIEATPRLEEVTSASFSALRSYANATRTLATGDRANGVRLLKAAIVADTGFAAAHRLMAATYTELGDRARAAEAFDHAIANQARLPFFERNHAIADHAMSVTHNYATAVDAYNRILDRNPGDVRVLNDLAMTYAARREYAVQESLFVRAIAVDSGVPTLYTGLATAQVNQGKYDNARRVLDRAERRFGGFRASQLAEVSFAASKQDWEAAERGARTNMTATPDDSTDALDGLEAVAAIAMTQGRLAEAEQSYRRVMALGMRGGSGRRSLLAALPVAYLELRYRHSAASAVATMNAALTRVPLAKLDEDTRPYDALARLYADAGHPDRARQLLDQAGATRLGRLRGSDAARHWTLGAIATAEGRVWEGEIEINQAADNLECPICALPDLARSYEVAGKPDLAIATYERYLNTPWQRRYETDDLELGFAMRRLGELYQQQNDGAKAAAQYKALLQLWQHADAELEPLLADVRRRLDQANEVVARR